MSIFVGVALSARSVGSLFTSDTRTPFECFRISTAGGLYENGLKDSPQIQFGSEASKMVNTRSMTKAMNAVPK